METATLLQRRRRSVRITKAEILLMLRAYQQHPTRWDDVIDEIRQNLDQLPPAASDLYSIANTKQLKDRLSAKLGKLMAARNIQDSDVRAEIENIRDMERRLVVHQPGPPIPNYGAGDRDLQVQDVQQNAGQPDDDGTQDRRDEAAAALSDNDTGDEVEQPPRRRRRLGELIRENHELYNNFMKRKLPRLMRGIGVDFSDDD